MLGFLQEINNQNVIFRMALMGLSGVWKGWEMQIFSFFFFFLFTRHLFVPGVFFPFSVLMGP